MNLRIALLCCVTRRDDETALRRAFPAWIRRFLHDAWNRLNWKLRSRFTYHYWHYDSAIPRNAGDSAIREATYQQWSEAAPGLSAQFLEIPWRLMDASQARTVNDHCDLAVISAGALAHVDPEGELSENFQRYLDFVRQLKKPVLCYGLGVSTPVDVGRRTLPAPSASASRDLAEFFSRTRLAGIRDPLSYDFLLRAGVDGGNLRPITDPALFLRGGRAVRPPATPPRIGLNFCFHGRHPMSLATRYAGVYVAAVEEIRRRIPGCEFTYFSHCPPDTCLALVLEASGIPLKMIRGGPFELLEEYGRIDVHMGQMLHSCILAANAGTPVLALAYDSKNVGFFSQIGMPGFCLTPEEWNPAVIAEKVVELFERRQLYSGRLAAAVRRLREPQFAFLAEALASCPGGMPGV